jgi:hypothetical protein
MKDEAEIAAKVRKTVVILRWATAAVFLLLAAARSMAVTYLQEGFDYPPGNLGNNPPWTDSTGLIAVTNYGLSYPYLLAFSPPSNGVIVSEGSSVVSYRPLTTAATSGSVYFSFLINFATLPGNYHIAGLTQRTNASPGGAADDPLDLVDGSPGSGYNFGVRSMGSATSYMTNGAFLLNTNTTYFIVMKYNFTNGGASLYVNPPAGNTEPSTPDAFSSGSNIAPDLSYAYLRVGSASAGNFEISSWRVASTWQEVTPASNAATAYSQAAMLSAFLDSLQVDDYWLVGYSVNWFTGAAGGSGPNMTLGTDSHCSAFAAAVADLLGIYILRQPDASDINVANNQADWLPTNTAGWFPIGSMTEAQHLANTGTLAVASYFNPDGSGHIAVLRGSNRTDASVNTFGPEECQSGDYNYADTNVMTGFSEHPGSFPSNIYYYGHTVTYPVSPASLAFGRSFVSNQTFRANISTIVGRTYQVQRTANLTFWTPLLTFTNSNDSTSFWTNVLITDTVTGRGFYRLLAQ